MVDMLDGDVSLSLSLLLECLLKAPMASLRSAPITSSIGSFG